MEKNLADFQDASLEKLVEHALLALRDTLPAEENLTEDVSYIRALIVDQASSPFRIRVLPSWGEVSHSR